MITHHELSPTLLTDANGIVSVVKSICIVTENLFQSALESYSVIAPATSSWWL